MHRYTVRTIITLCVCLWFYLGGFGFIHWWTKDYDLTTEHIPVLIIISGFGPFSYVVGWYIHGDREEKVLIKKRN